MLPSKGGKPGLTGNGRLSPAQGPAGQTGAGGEAGSQSRGARGLCRKLA